jgi:alkylation response protein AidB-like acyl-CoA dehydrogenase
VPLARSAPGPVPAIVTRMSEVGAVVAHPIVGAVRRFVEAEVVPAATALEHADAYPHALVDRMRELGLFGALVPAAYGGLGLGVAVYARVIEELCRGWMSLAGVINSHTMAALIVLQHGTDEQRGRLLPRFASGAARGGLCLTEPQAGSDVQAIQTKAQREGDHYLITGSKMFVTNGREGNTFALLARTDTAVDPPHRGMSCFIVEKGPAELTVVKSIAKLGYKGVDTAELVFDRFPVPAANLVGGVEGRGFRHVMSGLETGRINIAARAVGVAQAALEEAAAAIRRDAAEAGLGALAGIATRVEAARCLTAWAAGMKDRAERCDLEAGMAKLYASEAAQDVAVETLRLAGRRGQLADTPIERLYRDTPLMIIGEGANEIQRLLIARQLLERYGERAGLVLPRESEPEERRQMVLAVRQLIQKDVVPLAQEQDALGRHPADLVARLAELGVWGALVPADHGGLGLDLVTAAELVEEVARGWGTLGGLLAAHVAATHVIARHAVPAVRDRLLPAMACAGRLGCVARGGSAAARRATGGWGLTGDAPLTAGADQAAVLVLIAELGGRDTAFLAEAGAPGLEVRPAAATLGFRGLGVADVAFAHLRLPPEARLGRDGVAAAQAATEAASLRCLGEAAVAVGLGEAALEAALRYAQQRHTFGKAIGQHQAIQLKLADMATRVTAARLLVHRAAERLTLRPGDAAAAAMARLEATEAAYHAALESMRTHGGYGYTKEFPVERLYRDAGALLAGAGARDRLRLAVAREVMSPECP